MIDSQCASNINTVAGELSHQKIWVARSLHSDKIIVVDDGWGISLTFSTVTVKQLEIAQVVLSEVSSSDSNEQKIKTIYL